MKELVFLLEEASAKALLTTLLPRLLNAEISFRLIPFEGKQDLEKQLVKRIRGYQNRNARFIVLRDLDSHPDCLQLKQRLVALCQETGKAENCLVRLACRELEAFYLADLAAVERALTVSGLSKKQNTNKFRTPDALGSPSRELKQLTGQVYEKIAGSVAIGEHIELDNTRSPSFRNLVAGIRRLEQELMVGN
ncbi:MULTISPECIES: DUF4276 family protein [Methylomonas]|uniref:DUF4276 domain-containing protein n=2 Tax=Methylomonas TaxID=416 RepID=A0A140E5C6_9GAMM|nr:MULTISPECIES: DUF4276 family protein [Methylomonas]AMK75600.1 hypothetical protein JT25_003710 [Methylomonas denitrificans]OAI08864.1 hypothetical protein A1342_08445 [Methylomonas methanica]TCV73851.1 uncharacterized protein DUF4276 [Methylomonas methanica]